jgi:hypothetical protein
VEQNKLIRKTVQTEICNETEEKRLIKTTYFAKFPVNDMIPDSHFICSGDLMETLWLIFMYHILRRRINAAFLKYTIKECKTVYIPSLLGMFAKLRKVAIFFVVSVLPTVRMEQLRSHCTFLNEIWYLNIFRKYVNKNSKSLKSDKNNGYFI